MAHKGTPTKAKLVGAGYFDLMFDYLTPAKSADRTPLIEWSFFLADQGISPVDATGEMLNDWADELNRKEVNDYTAVIHVGAVIKLYTWLARKGVPVQASMLIGPASPAKVLGADVDEDDLVMKFINQVGSYTLKLVYEEALDKWERFIWNKGISLRDAPREQRRSWAYLLLRTGTRGEPVSAYNRSVDAFERWLSAASA